MTACAMEPHDAAEDRLAAVVQDYRSGMHVLALLAKHGIAHGTLQRVLKANSVERGSRRPAPKPIDQAKAAAIEQDYRDGIKSDLILERHKIGTKTLHLVLRQRGVPLRGRSLRAWSIDADPDTSRVLDLFRSGVIAREISERLGVGRHRVRRIIRASAVDQHRTEARSARAKLALGGASRTKLSSVPATQWAAWRAAGASLSNVAQQLGVSRSSLQSFAKESGIELPVYRPAKRQPTTWRPRGVRVPVPQAVTEPAQWTWFDYVEITGREFATPPHLRQGPVIKAWLEANGVKP